MKVYTIAQFPLGINDAFLITFFIYYFLKTDHFYFLEGQNDALLCGNSSDAG